MSRIKKRAIILCGILLVLISSGFVSGAKPRVIVLSNSIDYELASEFFGFLGNKGMDVIHVSGNDFEQYKEEKFVVILGGPDAPEGVGEIVQGVLTADEQDYVRASGNRKMFTKTNVWTNGQRVSVIAGSDRDQTKFAHVENRDDVVSSVNEANDQSQTPTTTPAPSKSKELSLKWSVDDTEYFFGDNYVHDVSISNSGLIGAKFESGFTYIIDKEGNTLWHKKVAGPISYAFYLQSGWDASIAYATEGDFIFSVLENGRIVKVSPSFIQLLNNKGALITSHDFTYDKVREARITTTETADISYDEKYVITTSHTAASSVMGLYPVSTEIKRKWYLYRKGTSFYTAKFSPNSKYIAAITATSIDIMTDSDTIVYDWPNFAYGWLDLYNINSEKLWGKNLATRLIDVDISQDAKCVVAIDNEMYLYLLDSQGEVVLTENIGGNTYSVALAPDCSYLVVGVDDFVKYYEIT